MTQTLAKQTNKVSSARFKQEGVAFNALLVVYEVEKTAWRGFVHPYGETTEADSKEEAIKKLRALTDAYYNTLVKYNSPVNLVNGHLEDVEDRKVFNWVIGNKTLMEGVHSEEGKADSEFCYVEAYGG